MSTNNQHALNGETKEIRPSFESAIWSIKKLSAQRLQAKMNNHIGEITGMSLQDRGIE